MSLRRRGGVWWIDVGAPNGERIRRTTGTADKALAREFHDRIKAELWRIDRLGVKPKHTWNDAVVRWLKENGHKATASEDVTKLRFLDRYLRDKNLAAIDRTAIDRVTREKLAQGCSNATVNRTLELLRAVLRKCVNEWEWLDRAPYVRMLKEPTRRIRFLTHEEARRLLAELPAHLADMAAFSLSTGLRAANVTGLEWSQVDEERKLCWVHPDQAKARKAIAVQLNGEALAIVQKQKGIHPTHVFSVRANRLRRSAPRPGMAVSSERGSTISAGTTCAIRGRAGTYRAARHSSPCRNWGAGSLPRWSAVMRISRRITWHLLRIV